MAKAKRGIKPNFVANPGLGWVFIFKDLPKAGMQFWQGALTLEDGTRTIVEVTAHLEPKESRHYEFKVSDPTGDPNGEKSAWKTLSQFTMPAFGNLNARTVNAPGIGTIRVWRATTPGGRNAIRMRINAPALTPRPM